MIGFYDYTVVATYLSLVFGVSGIFFAFDGLPAASIFCLLCAGLLDAFDGRIARTKKGRSDQEKRFGIQIDSLNDMVCFGVLPAAIGYSMGNDHPLYTATLVFFVLTALIRLAYFNVIEEERQSATDAARKTYLGLPVTSVSFLLPLTYLLSRLTPFGTDTVLAAALFLFGVLFISPIKIPKPGLAAILLMAVVGAAEMGAIVWLLAKGI